MTVTPPTATLRHEWRDINGVKLHCVVSGTGPLVVLLHGFPELWYSWRHQITALAEHFTVVAPDMRGYNLSDKPRGVGAYAVPTLVEDVAQLAYSFGEDQAHIVGHDWGGAVAWATALARPDLVRTLNILNCPHPRILMQSFLTNPRQLRRSWYMFVFQLPLLPELGFRSNNAEAIAEAFRRNTAHPEAFSDQDIAAYRAAALQPGALTSMVNYYRSMMRPTSQRWLMSLDPVVKVPTQVIWGERDFALGKELNHLLPAYVPDLTLHFIPDASHWVQQDRPDLVNQYLLEFLR